MDSIIDNQFLINSDLNLSGNQFKKILDNSYDEIFVVNSKGIVVYVNEACHRNYGLKPSEVIGKTVYHLVNEGYYNPALAPLVFKEKKTITLEQNTRFGKKLVVTATPVFNDNNEIELIVMNSRDITQIEKLKQALEETKDLVNLYKSEIIELRQQQIYSYEGFSFRSKKMKVCVEIARRVAPMETTLLILGQSGTGKNIIAKEVHRLSQRKNGPFIIINCAAIPEQLFESELFGYRSGAFTGAERFGKVGLVELANKGTLFLDEIGEIPLSIQAKLLELIQEHSFIPVGGKEHKTVDIRILAATNCNLPRLVEEGKFRGDLYYRLNVIEIEIPPLKERTEDIIPLLYFFLNKFDTKYETSHQFDQACLDILKNYSWPGNIREVEHLVERLVITTNDGKIIPEQLPKQILSPNVVDTKMQYDVPFNKLLAEQEEFNTQNYSLKENEKDLIIKLYRELKSSYKVANLLKISQSKVSRTVRKFLAE